MGPRAYFMPLRSPSTGRGRLLKPPGHSGESESRESMYPHLLPGEG